MRRMNWAAVGLLFALGTSPLSAHEFWLDPKVDDGIVSAQLRVGQDFSGSALPYLDTTIAEMTHVSPAGARRVEARLGDRPAIGGVELLKDGLHVLTVETQPSYIVFDDLKEFDDYLTYEGLDGVAAAHVARNLSTSEIAEEYIRNARALISVGQTNASDVDRATGLPFELVAIGNPFLQGADTLSVRLTWKGAPVEGLQVALFHVPDGQTAPKGTTRYLARTDDNGIARFESAGAGAYLLNAVKIDAADGPGSVVWRSYWASLTFDIE